MSKRVMWLVILLAALAQVPEQPDFSGRWVLEELTAVSADAARRLVVLQPFTRTNVFGEPMQAGFLTISIRREGALGSSEETRLIGVVGGTVSGLAKDGHHAGGSTRVETVWRRNALVFVNLTHGPDGPRTGEWTDRREEWTLDRDGRLRVERSTQTWKVARRVDVYFYRRERTPN